MRLILLICALLTWVVSFGQQGGGQPGGSPSLFTTVRPEGTVVVRRHETGSEIVEITMLDAKYPEDLLRQQSKDLASQLGQDAQGLFVTRNPISKDDPSLVFVRSQFGVTGMAEPGKGIYRLNAIARAFAGAPEPFTVNGLSVQFESMLPGAETLRHYEDEHVAVELSPMAGQIGVEYRIQIKSQNPAEIKIPEARPEKKVEAAKPEEKRTDWVVIVLGLLAAAALGALVYSLLLRVRPRSGPAPR